MASWEQLGEVANVAQLTGLDAVRLIGMIVSAASSARTHKKNCQKFALHLKLIGNLLEQLRISELKKYEETREPLELLEDALRRSYVLVNSCQHRSYLYLLAAGWNIVYQFRKAQTEIDFYLRLIPLISLVDNARVMERLEYIGKNKNDYTLDEEEMKVQDVILNPEISNDQTVTLKKTLSCSYPNMGFNEALQEENEKLHHELERSQANLDVSQCEVIQHLIDVTEAAASNSVDSENPASNLCSNVESNCLDANEKEHSCGESYNINGGSCTKSRNVSSVSSSHDLLSRRGSHQHEEWNSDLLGCCSEPFLCIRTFFFPCGTFSKIASVATSRHISPAEACNELMAYSLILSCCCYTCCIRRKLRRMLNITGGFVDDFLSHFICCCCALVQEWREIESRRVKGPEKTRTSPPCSQSMEY